MSAAICDSEPIKSEPTSTDGIDWSTRETSEGLEHITRHYYDWSQQLADLAIRNLASNADPDAIRSAAGYGLLQAVRSFDPRKGIKFRTFAILRIRGAIIDEVRSTCPAKRSAHALIKARHAAEADLLAELGRSPTQDDICDRLGWSRKEYLYSLGVTQQSLSKVTNEFEAKDGYLGDFIGEVDPQSELERSGVFEEIMRGFTMEEKTLMYLYYYRDANMKAIGGVLGLAESRISQVHASIIKRLRELRREF